MVPPSYTLSFTLWLYLEMVFIKKKKELKKYIYVWSTSGKSGKIISDVALWISAQKCGNVSEDLRGDYVSSLCFCGKIIIINPLFCKRSFCVWIWLKWLLSPWPVSRRCRAPVCVCVCVINGAELGDTAEASGCGNSSTSVNHTACEWRARKSIKPNLAAAVPCLAPWALSPVWINSGCFKTFRCFLWASFFFCFFLTGPGASGAVCNASLYHITKSLYL